MTVVFCSGNIRAPENDSHDVPAKVAKSIMPPTIFSRCGAITFISKEESKLTGKGMKMREVNVHDEDDASMWITGGRLPDGMVVEADVMPFPEIRERDNMLGLRAWTC
jgi:hypothetical protein